MVCMVCLINICLRWLVCFKFVNKGWCVSVIGDIFREIFCWCYVLYKVGIVC